MLQRILDNQSLKKAFALIGMLLFGFGTAFFAYAGTFSRYWADDYCYSAEIKQVGLFAGMVDWWYVSGNRVTTLIFVMISDWIGRLAVSWGPLLLLALFTAAWIFFLSRLFRLLDWELPWYWLGLLSVVQVYFAVLLSPTRLQVIYWRMGSFHYTLPLPLLLVILGLVLGAIKQSGRGAAWIMPLSGLLAFIAAGLSETAAVLHLAVLLAVLGLVILTPSPRRKQNIGLLLTPVIGTLLMIPIMLLAPANAFRQALLPPPDNKLLILVYSLRYAVEFVYFTIRGSIVPFAVYIAGMASLALLAFPRKKMSLPAVRLALLALAVLLATYLFIVSSFMPSAVGGLAYPAPRALMPGSIILLAGLGAAVVLAVFALRTFAPGFERSWATVLALLLLAAVCLYPLRGTAAARQDIAQLSARTARWDARDAQITQAVAAGEKNILVKQTDVIQTLEDYGPDPSFWINRCAAVFYGVHSITAQP